MEDSDNFGLWVAVFVLLVLMFFVLLIEGVVYGDYQQMKTFNKYHNTDYTYDEWFWSSSVIKDYVEGKQLNINYDTP